MITLQKIAQLANVSVGTVDRVIHNRGRVSQKTADRIKRIIKELDYKPNILAQSLSLSRTREYNFGVLVPKPTQDGRYWELPVKGINKAREELNIYRVNTIYFLYDKYSEISFKKAFTKIFQSEKKLDGLIITPVLSQTAQDLIKKIPPDLPYVFLDSYIPQSNCLTYIGEESYQSGKLAATLMDILINSRGTIAAIKVRPKDNHLEDRVKGFRDYFKDKTNVTFKSFKANRKKDVRAFYNITRDIIKDIDNLKGIFVPNSTTYQIAECVKSYALDSGINIIGYDLVEENIFYLKKGIIKFLISQRSELQGYMCIYSLYKNIALHEKLKNKIMMPMDIITKDNIDYYHV
ncbi:substrate-binding domain-containing protein [candidate division KSB1 bacterium]|nr:substrate-binding domain-containing protein [candidate division KSB1 bacterium]